MKIGQKYHCMSMRCMSNVNIVINTNKMFYFMFTFYLYKYFTVAYLNTFILQFINKVTTNLHKLKTSNRTRSTFVYEMCINGRK